MKTTVIVALLLGFPSWLPAQPNTAKVDSVNRMDLNTLIGEALENNPDIQSAVFMMDVASARVSQAGSLDDLQFRYMREQMPSMENGEETAHRFELMQMIRFPSKLSAESKISTIESQHAHHEHQEITNNVLSRLKSIYAELWYSQQALSLNRENIRLLEQFATLARTKYSVGTASQQDFLKATVELAKLENQGTVLRQQELAAKAMLQALLNRAPKDTLATATLPDSVHFSANLDTLEALTVEFRPMLIHDSLSIDQSKAMVSLANREYLPDLRLGVEYVRNPLANFDGWNLIAGISIPFAPWTLGKASGRVEEAEFDERRATATYRASRNMVFADLRESYLKIVSAKSQIEMYQGTILPQAEQSLQSSLIAYQGGKTDFLMLIDSYRMLVELSMEGLMLRMQYEQAVAQLERAVGLDGIANN